VPAKGNRIALAWWTPTREPRNVQWHVSRRSVCEMETFHAMRRPRQQARRLVKGLLFLAALGLRALSPAASPPMVEPVSHGLRTIKPGHGSTVSGAMCRQRSGRACRARRDRGENLPKWARVLESTNWRNALQHGCTRTLPWHLCRAYLAACDPRLLFLAQGGASSDTRCALGHALPSDVLQRDRNPARPVRRFGAASAMSLSQFAAA